MEVEKRGSRGGFFHMFDWNRKSRKKLFLNNSELFEELGQGKERVENLGALRPSQEEVDENGASSSIKGSSDYNYASSVSGDDGYETRAPGVVARLMGLDSLPTSGVCEPCSSSSLDTCSLKDVHYKGFLSEHHSMSYNNMPNKLEGDRVSPVESRPRRVQRRPIERFQTEMLPPKSAKSIPFTHHKLLSPIKSPGFIPTKNATYVMEAAAKIIEPGPHATPKRKVPSVGSSSVPLRIRDLKEKMEAAQKSSRLQRPKQSTDVKHMNGQINGKRFNGSEDTPSLNNSKDLVKRNSDSMKKKGKSVSLAEQAKVNIQRKEGPSSSNRSSMNPKEHTEVKSGQSSKSQPSMQKNMLKRTSTNRTSNALKQNNQKQNGGSTRDVLTSKTAVSNQKSKKAPSVNGSFGPSKTVNKVVINTEAGSKKMGSVANDIRKESSLSKTKNASRKKLSVDGNICFEGSIADGVLTNKDVKSIKCNVAVEGGTDWGGDNIKKGMDVVSFTFTSPMKKPIPGSMSSDQVMEAKYQFNIDSNDENDAHGSKNSSISSLGPNVIGADSLGVLLEQKLRELTFRVGSSHSDLFAPGTAASSTSRLQDSDLRVNVVAPTSTKHTSRLLPDLHEDKSDGPHYFDFSSVGGLQANQKWQVHVSEGMEELSGNSNNNEMGNGLSGQHPSPVLSLESSFSNITCNSPDSRNSYSVNGSEQCSLAETDEVDSWTSRSKSQLAEGEAELSDSASSVSILHMNPRNMASTSHLTDFKESVNWELEYMREILCKAELTLEDFASGHTHKFITPNLFDQLENQEPRSERNGEESSKLGRKVLFDYMGEFLDLRCGQLFGGSRKAWAKWATLIERKGWLAEELYNEILSWRSMGEFMVDELVDKDMSTQYGKWLDFEFEAFEEGVEIENIIITSLVDELVDDLFSF
ncbi:hypothetical protein VitviT2T_020861 [Vitis vinifera]|uniref:DUF4378 domain-containing protein n=1 Tax=Vitis vinifera TaxID=29760 RepID=A0ABY9D5A3_VITVI|nr:uncharacterized protein LOC100264914 [Vitis vinifera]XP_010659683.1 uncharacterized protein LOC100264914 [Vitis vinifera]XP_019080792.1 uncharacterized protein LOC100264914 [Vitis vinifera]XP_059598522.1 uncharacterized protein LOC100264914 [Vitis vinifera]XP_059598523.1 uncharacterized protein LOC100264914 [Vitis vinifera]WKA02703.1 hypothetical protein VitviT2T_020861 [Vitis vinifera]|eukprot:XP_010659682.1 PREDICTED: uncharacterized protein LOC100264914 [Vitis vinifera]